MTALLALSLLACTQKDSDKGADSGGGLAAEPPYSDEALDALEGGAR